MTGNSFSLHSHQDHTSREYFHHSSAPRVNTNIALVEALRRQYPNLNLTVAPQGTLNLLAYTSSGNATATPIQDSVNDPIYGAALTIRSFIPPPRRLGTLPGVIAEEVVFGKYMYKWEGHEFLLYIANGRDGSASYPDITYHYILANETHKVDELLKEATLWGDELHNEVWVFDQGYWQKSRELWESVQKSRWEDVILEEGMKKAIIADVENFFDGQETYTKLRVPWKRGIIYYGPPGNGKTISIKAMMHSLYQRGQSNSKLYVPTLYVRTLASFAGPEYSLRSIFTKARETAPCYLVFEDLDSIVSDQVRSYFLNEVDGLKSNDGILMVGSTNHLDRLDPGISKRPSRFDRKYFFPNPDFDQRVAYAKFWQGKLKDNDDLEFPDELCPAIAKITDKFSFAYMQEAFIASLLAIAVRGEGDNVPGCPEYAGLQDPVRGAAARVRQSAELPYTDLDELILWKEIQVQVKILREEMGDESGDQIQPPKLSTVYGQAREPDLAKRRDTNTPERSLLTSLPKLEIGGKAPGQTTPNRSLFADFEAWKAGLMPATETKVLPLRDTTEEKSRHDTQELAQLIKVMGSLDTRTKGYGYPLTSTSNTQANAPPKPPTSLPTLSKHDPLACYDPAIDIKTYPKIDLTMRSSNLPAFEDEGAREAKFGFADWKPRNAPREGMVELPARPLQQRVTPLTGYSTTAAQSPQIPMDRARVGTFGGFFAPPNQASSAYPLPTVAQTPLGKRSSLEAGQPPLSGPYSGFGQKNWPSKGSQ